MENGLAGGDRGEMERILNEETVGYVGLCSDGEPYVIPVNYVYTDGTIVFHGSFTGKKNDFIRANPRTCFVVGRQTGEVRDHAGATSCHIDNDSVICYGTARLVENVEERWAALNVFNRRFHPETDGIARERAEKCCVVEIRITEMTGRVERDRSYRRMRHVFAGDDSDTPAAEEMGGSAVDCGD